MTKARVCELCNEAAALYCASDSAFLCWKCDARVHEANFLVARHVRCTLCVRCKRFDGNRVSGVGTQPLSPAYRSCLPESPCHELDSLSSSSSSACVLSTESFGTFPGKVDFGRGEMDKILSSSSVTGITSDNSISPASFTDEITSPETRKSSAESKRKSPTAMISRGPPKVDRKVEGVFGSWSRKLGLDGNFNIRVASQAFSFSLTTLPFRVALAASFWFSLRLSRGRSFSTCQNLKRLEEISGVPAKVILAAQTKLARVLRDRKTLRNEEESWAESQSSV